MNRKFVCKFDNFQLFESGDSESIYIFGSPPHSLEFYKRLFSSDSKMNAKFDTKENMFSSKMISDGKFIVTRKNHISTDFFDFGTFKVIEEWSVEMTEDEVKLTTSVLPSKEMELGVFQIENGHGRITINESQISGDFYYDTCLNDMMKTFFNVACFKILITTLK